VTTKGRRREEIGLDDKFLLERISEFKIFFFPVREIKFMHGVT
jgi:hypothetical protein